MKKAHGVDSAPFNKTTMVYLIKLLFFTFKWLEKSL